MPGEEVSAEQQPENTASIVKTKTVKTKPFNYQQFLSLLKQPDSRDVVTTIRKFIEAFRFEYSKKLCVSEQVEAYRKYRYELAESMLDHPVWVAAGPEAREMALEGVEYMTMNQLYAVSFCPPNSDDRERDEAIDKKMFLYSWIEAKHLDFSLEFDVEALKLAGEEFKAADEHTTPRDKMIRFMNGARILGKSIKAEDAKINADVLMPLYILALIKARPARLYSNLQYISRYRNGRELSGQNDYNLTGFLGAASFIEKLDKSALVVEQEEFEQRMEDAVARFNEDSLQKQAELQRKHQEEMMKREQEMLRADQAAHQARRDHLESNSFGRQRSPSSELRLLLGDLEENGSRLMQKVRQSSFVKQSKGVFSEFVSEAKSVVRSLVDESDEEEERKTAATPKTKVRTLEEEEEYQLQMALALSLSEAEANKERDKQKI